MKKLLALIICIFTLNIVVFADNDKVITVNQLPKTSQNFINTHFSDKEVTYVKQEIDNLITEGYEILFKDGTKIEFDRKGNWENIKCMNGVLPALIPTDITKYVSSSMPNTTIVEIDKDDRGHIEIKLNNGMELTFDKKFNLIDIDD